MTYLAQRAVPVESAARARLLGLAARLDDVIPLGRGDPDFDTPAPIVRGGVRALEAGLHHYSPPAGLPELREAIGVELSQAKSLEYSPDQVIVCNGCQEALLIAILSLVDPGDEVVLPAPRFTAFDAMVALAGGTVVSVQTRQADDFAFKAEAIRGVLTDKTKLVIVANPNNPTGALLERKDLLGIAALAIENDLLLLSDEIYEKIIFDGRTHTSLAGLDDLYERTATVNGFSKAYAMTGWRVGYLATPTWLAKPAAKIKHTVSICTPPAMQMGALAALRHGADDSKAMVRQYQARRDRILACLDRSGLTYGRPGGAMYIYANVSATGLDAETFCHQLLERERVLIFPGTGFADKGNRHVRMTVLSTDAQTDEALTRLERFIGSL